MSELSDEQHKRADVVPNVGLRAIMDNHAPKLSTGLPTDASSLPGRPQDGSLSDANRDRSLEDVSSAAEHDSSQAEHGTVHSPKSKSFTPLLAGGTASSPGFTFSRLDRRNLELGGKRKDLHRGARRNDSSPASMPPAPEDAQHTVAPTMILTSPLASAEGIGHAHTRSAEATPHGSDVATGCHTTQSEDVVYMGTNRSQYPGYAISGPAVVETRPHILQPLHCLSQEANKTSPTAPLNIRADRETFQVSAAPTPACKSSIELTRRRPIPQPPFQVSGNANVPPTQGGIQELLEVVKYKFEQNEQRLRQAFFADSNKVQRELKQAYEENEDLQSRVAILEDRCTSSEATIVKYRIQIGKAKGLQRFLDGLGSDLQSLKRSYDTEKSVFAERIEASETEISRLKSTLAGKNEFESMLSHSKASLEKLLEARNFELQSLVQHRDMLRSQLDERIGQLVEERDARSRLEQLVAELRVSERISLTASIEQCAASLVSRFGDFCRQDDQLVVGIAGLQNAIKTLTERPSVTSDDCEAIKSEIRVLGMSIVQGISVEAATSMTVAEVSSSVEGIVQTHVQKLCQGLDRLESVSKQTSGDASEQASLRLQLQGLADSLKFAEIQLESEKQNKASIEKSLDQSISRVAELEVASISAAGSATNSITPQDIENRVNCTERSLLQCRSLMRTKINEAVAEAQKQLSNSANTFIAQEKSRYCNEYKKIESEHRKALERLHLQNEEINKLRTKLDEMQSSTKANPDRGSAQQLDGMVDRFRALEKQHHAVRLELNDKRSLEPRLVALSAERDAAGTRISTCETKITTLTQEIDRCSANLLQARSSEERAKVQVEELRNQNQSDVDELRRKLSQTQEKAKYAEAGLVQMKTNAEKTILEEEERHRKQQEALQQRLDEAQSELQMKSEEADEHRAFVERTVAQQQAAWQRLNAELETKISDYKTQHDKTSQLLHDAQEERDTLQTTIASLQAEIQQHQQFETEHRSREDISRAVMDDLRHQLDAAQTKISGLQAVQQRYLREKEERSSREARAKSALETLRKEYDAAGALIADLKVSEKQSKDDEAVRKQRDVELQKELGDVCHERDTAQAALRKLEEKYADTQNSQSIDAGEKCWAALQPEPDGRSSVENFVQTSGPTCPAISKQRKPADRNTNTIVSSEVGNVRAMTRPSRPDVLPGQAQVVIPVSSNRKTDLSSHDEMLDVVSSQPGDGMESQLVSSMQTYQHSSRRPLQGQTSTSQTLPASLNFSGRPLVATKDPLAERVHSLDPSQSHSGSDFKIYEDAQNSFNGGFDEEDSARANFTFRKPFPLPNSGSKRLTRTTSDRSLNERTASSRGTRRTPENSGALLASQPNKTPESSKYPFGSSPEFMNPPSTKTKRRYSGGPTTSGNFESHASRRSTPVPDSRIAARPGGSKRVAARDMQSQTDMEPPTKKRNATQTAAKPKGTLPSDDVFLGRSSQSVNDLPRTENLNAGRVGGQMQASHMRTSAGSRHVTRNQKASKGQYHHLAHA
jgi:chromosome segregation ATPase